MPVVPEGEKPPNPFPDSQVGELRRAMPVLGAMAFLALSVGVLAQCSGSEQSDPVPHTQLQFEPVTTAPLPPLGSETTIVVD